MRMLVVAPEPVFTPRGTPFSVYHRMAVAAELGVEIDLLTYAEGADPDLPGLTIHRIPRLPWLRPPKVGPSLGKVVRDVFMVLRTLELLIRRRPDVVHAHEEAVFWCRALKPVFGYRLVYDMHSSLPQQLTNFGYTSSRLLIGLFERLENSALAASDAVITISPRLAELATSRMPDEERHALIENSLLDAVRLRDDDGGAAGGRAGTGAAAAEPPGWPEGWHESDVVMYAGTLEPYQGIGMLLEAFVHVVRRRPAARLAIVGGDPAQVEAYRRRARELGVDDVTWFAGTVNQPVARRLMGRAAVLLSPRTRGTNTPLKVYELLASGVPFVASRIESHTQVLGEAVCLMAEPEPTAFAEAIVVALDGGDSVADRVRRARRLYEERYSRSAYRAKLAGLLDLLSVDGSEALQSRPSR